MRYRKKGEAGRPPKTREELEAEFGPVYDVRALASRFTLLGIDGTRVVARRKKDAAVGTLRFQMAPLLFFCFESFRRR